MCELKFFADDSKLLSVINNDVDASNVQKDLVTVTEWTNQWSMKYKVLHFGRNNPKASYILRDESGQIKEIGHTITERDLGMMIAEDVKWKNHMNHVVNKANRMQGLLRNRTFESRDHLLSKDLYVALIRPHLEYAVQTWNPHLIGDRD